MPIRQEPGPICHEAAIGLGSNIQEGPLILQKDQVVLAVRPSVQALSHVGVALASWGNSCLLQPSESHAPH